MVSFLGVTGVEAKSATQKIYQTISQRCNCCDSGTKAPTRFRELYSTSLLSLLSILILPVMGSMSTLYRVLFIYF